MDTLGRRAAEAETGAVVVTEHFRVWSDWERSGFEAQWGVRIYRAIEHTTRQGHVIVIGAEPAARLPDDTTDLLHHARERGWYTILAHPFRHYFDKIHGSQTPAFPPGTSPEELAQMPIFALADAIEIENGDCTEDENRLAAEVAALVNLPVTAGSDAHHEEEIGRRRLPAPSVPADELELADFVRGLRQGG